MIELNRLYNEPCRETMKRMDDNSINLVMTSPPYWALRDYGTGKDQLGLEPTFDLYIQHLCDIFDEVKRVLRDDGTIWINIGDSYGQNWRGGTEDTKDDYAKKHGNRNWKKEWGKEKINTGVPPKSLVMTPFRFAIEMVNRGWILRNTIIWHKRNCMPSSAKDRFTVDYEYLFFFSKKKKYYFEQQFDKHQSPPDQIERQKRTDNDSKYGQFIGGGSHSGGVGFGIQGRNKRTVWTINPKPFSEAHFAVYPEELCETPIKAGCPEGGIVYDPFFGSGTTGLVAHRLNRKFIGSEISKEYCKIAEKRLAVTKQIQFV